MEANGYGPVLEETIGHVAVLRINCPQKRNPLSFTLADELVSRLTRVNGDPDVRVVILTGMEQSFCAGGDQQDFSAASAKGITDQIEDYPPINLFRMGREMRKPLIAAVNGPALGGGLGLVCMSHVAIAAEQASFGLPEINIGTFPLTVLPLIRPVLGERRTMELALSGRRMSAHEAHECGLVKDVVPHQDLDDRTLELANEYATRSPMALYLGLKAYQESQDMPFSDAMEYLNVLRAMSFSTEDLNEGARAFLERRAPSWKGR